MFSLNPEDTRVILIGASEFEDENLFSLPAIKDNNVKLRALLCEVVGISKDNIHILEDREWSNQITSEISEIAAKGLDIIYYAGHGLPHLKQLYLATKKTELDDPESTGALLADNLVRTIINKGKAKRIIFILDCCFSGFAREKIDTKGKDVFLITATSSVETAKAEAPENNNYTAFTHELLEILEQGIDSAGEILTLQNIFSCLKERLESKNLPLPRITSYGSPSEFEICKNRACQKLTQDTKTALLSPNDKKTVVSGKKYKVNTDNLRPHLPNRRPQETQLGRAIQNHKQHPLLCLIHSDECQCSDRFVDRLVHHYLPKVVPGDGITPYFVHCNFSEGIDLHQEISEQLASKLGINPFAPHFEIVDAIVRERSPIIFYTDMCTKNWLRCEGIKIVYDFIEFWAKLELPSTHNHLLLICLYFNYKDIKQTNIIKRWFKKKSINDQIRKEFEQLKTENFLEKFGINGIVLPELVNIEKEDVEAWARDHLYNVLNIVQPKIDNLFTSPDETIPMCDLARELSKILEEFSPDVFRV